MVKLFSVLLLVFVPIVLVELKTSEVNVTSPCPLKHQEMKECVKDCPDYCHEDRNDSKLPCKAICHKGCGCKRGYIKEAVDSDLCISMRKCANRPKCASNQIFKTCGPLCTPICYLTDEQEFNPVPNCHPGLGCRRGCFCRSGYYFRNASEVECITENECVNSVLLIEYCVKYFPYYTVDELAQAQKSCDDQCGVTTSKYVVVD